METNGFASLHGVDMMACCAMVWLCSKRFRPLLSPEEEALCSLLTNFKNELSKSQLAQRAPAFVRLLYRCGRLSLSWGDGVAA